MHQNARVCEGILFKFQCIEITELVVIWTVRAARVDPGFSSARANDIGASWFSPTKGA